MKLSLQDIQWHLGLHVPDDDPSLHPDDAFLYTRLLRLCSASACRSRRSPPTTRRACTKACVRPGGRTGNAALSAEDLERLRVSLRLTVERDFGLAVEPAQRKQP
ncbi:hypothetical protein [Burkholderia ubonensis]|uniref:hypothetical protein n=1 Tax=Burkholderia ubonensis TaxID=101571 RepID=UPI000A7BA605|nr:hypothetical protein [Burkholderia ubonensis]